MTETRVAQTVANLEAWLETMRVSPAAAPADGGRAPAGYGGPVVHWWQNCLAYTGPGLDWRYEGIISGYLTLWQRTGGRKWLQKARRAGDDLLAGQLPGGNFRCSAFELNPYAGGTPHEAAAALGLLRLALALRQEGEEGRRPYAAAAERNLRCYYLQRLWDEEAQLFRDHPHIPSFVPNKACTLTEALFAWADLNGSEEPITRHALPTLEAVLALQKTTPGRLQGAIAQSCLRGRVVEKYFPYYVARCVPALLLAYEHTGRQRWLDAAASAMAFVARHVDEQGLLPQVLYPRGANRYPQWTAPLGDVLRAADLLAVEGHRVQLPGLEQSLLRAQLPSGGLTTARGFGAQVSQRPPGEDAPDFRDCVATAGWCDKAFRYLACHVPPGKPLPKPHVQPATVDCRVRESDAVWTETAEEMSLFVDDRAVYRWRKGNPWATVCAPEVMCK